MLTDLEPAAPPPQFWSWKKASLGVLGLILAVVAFAYLYDPPLKPWDDLKLDNPEKSDVSNNGYAYLKHEWSRMPPLDQETRSAIRKLLMDPAAWDQQLTDSLRSHREVARGHLMEALRLPVYAQPVSEFPANPRIIDDVDWLSACYASVRLGFAAELRQGNPETARADLALLNDLACRQMVNGGGYIHFAAGLSFYHANLATLNVALDLSQPGLPPLDQLALFLKKAPPLMEGWHGVITYSNFSLSGLVEQMAHGEHDEEIGRLDRMLLKKNASLNLMREEMRQVMEIFDKTYPDARAAAEAEVRWAPPPELKGFAKWMPNASGIQAATAGARALLTVQHGVRFKARFVPNAMQVKIALLRWHAAHPDQWPAALTELVPDYLSAIPEDPWTGRPLLWDQATRTIFAVGSDYDPDRPGRGPYNRSTLLDSRDSPGLLVEPGLP